LAIRAGNLYEFFANFIEAVPSAGKGEFFTDDKINCPLAVILFFVSGEAGEFLPFGNLQGVDIRARVDCLLLEMLSQIVDVHFIFSGFVWVMLFQCTTKQSLHFFNLERRSWGVQLNNRFIFSTWSGVPGVKKCR